MCLVYVIVYTYGINHLKFNQYTCGVGGAKATSAWVFLHSTHMYTHTQCLLIHVVLHIRTYILFVCILLDYCSLLVIYH